MSWFGMSGVSPKPTATQPVVCTSNVKLISAHFIKQIREHEGTRTFADGAVPSSTISHCKVSVPSGLVNEPLFGALPVVPEPLPEPPVVSVVVVEGRG
jgi:hypothetical protein